MPSKNLENYVEILNMLKTLLCASFFFDFLVLFVFLHLHFAQSTEYSFAKSSFNNTMHTECTCVFALCALFMCRELKERHTIRKRHTRARARALWRANQDKRRGKKHSNPNICALCTKARSFLLVFNTIFLLLCVYFLSSSALSLWTDLIKWSNTREWQIYRTKICGAFLPASAVHTP